MNEALKKIEKLFDNLQVEMQGQFYKFYNNGKFEMNDKITNVEGYYFLFEKDNCIYLKTNPQTFCEENVLIRLSIGIVRVI